MQLFWKRVKEHKGSSSDGAAAGGLDMSGAFDSNEFGQTTAEADRSFHAPADTGSAGAKSKLVLVDEAEIHTLIERPEQIDIESLVDRLTDRRSLPKRGVVFWIWMAAAPAMAFWLIASLIGGDLRWAPLCLLVFATARAFGVQSAKQQQDRAALQNSSLDNRWLGPLCEALEWPDRRVRGIAARLLTQFLPRLREGDTGLLRDEHHNCLYRRLTTIEAFSDPELALAILAALPFIGNEAGLSYVDKLANSPAFTKNGRRVRGMARATLAGLERRIANNRALQFSAKVAALPLSSPAASDLSAGQDYQLSETEREEMAILNAHVDSQMAEFEQGMRNLQVPGMRMGFLIASGVVLFPYFTVQTVLQCLDGRWWLGILSAMMAVSCTQLYRLTLTAEHKRLARKLTKVEDVRCAGRLAEALEWPDANVRNIAIDALTRLLNRVKSTDKVLTTPRQRGNLHRMLALPNAQQHAEFLKSILQALGQVGDATSLPFVQNLANAQPTSARQREVCDAARDCLDYLKVRAELNRSSQTLLRASSANSTPAGMLVRPADARTLTDPTQLLRADTGDPTG